MRSVEGEWQTYFEIIGDEMTDAIESKEDYIAGLVVGAGMMFERLIPDPSVDLFIVKAAYDALMAEANAVGALVSALRRERDGDSRAMDSIRG